MWRRRLLFMRMRLSGALLRASWSALKREADPGMAVETKRSFPRMLCQALRETRLVLLRLVKIVARVSLRCGGSSRVCRRVSMIHPSMTFRVPQLPSPLSSFFKEMASFLWGSSSWG